MIKSIALAAFFAFPISVRAAEPRHADHEALRGMLKSVTDALNTRDLDALDPLLAKKFSVVTMDQRRFTGAAELKAYFASLFGGEHALLTSAEFHPEADELTEFVAPDVGVSHGTSRDTYRFVDGDTREMTSRWSAVVVKERGAWKLASLHVGVDLMDNPVLAAAKGALYKAAVLGALLGAAVGFVAAKALASGRSRR